MILTGNLNKTNFNDFDEVWAIVRSIKNPGRMKQVTELSPSRDLFFAYRRLVNDKRWGKDAFEQIYKPQFLRDFYASADAQRKLDELIELDKQGKKIALVCFCADASLCHRSIIADLLEEKGVSVIRR